MQVPIQLSVTADVNSTPARVRAGSSPLISVIVPAFNAAAFLAPALSSVRAQTYSNYEVIVVDDGSSDATPEVARTLTAADGRFSLLQISHAGVASARNAGLQRARGDWIAFLDADDLWLPEKLKTQVQIAFEDRHANLLFTNYFIWDGTETVGVRYEKRAKFPHGEVSRALVRANLFGMSSVMIRRDALLEAGLFDPRLSHAEDWELWLRVAEKGLWARGAWEPLARYRVWAGNASRQTLKMAEADVQVLEARAAKSSRSDLGHGYRRSIARARAKLELARFGARSTAAPDDLLPVLLRAWRHDRRRLKWLLWSLAVAWPAWLGGKMSASFVQRRLAAHT